MSLVTQSSRAHIFFTHDVVDDMPTTKTLRFVLLSSSILAIALPPASAIADDSIDSGAVATDETFGYSDEDGLSHEPETPNAYDQDSAGIEDPEATPQQSEISVGNEDPSIESTQNSLESSSSGSNAEKDSIKASFVIPVPIGPALPQLGRFVGGLGDLFARLGAADGAASGAAAAGVTTFGVAVDQQIGKVAGNVDHPVSCSLGGRSCAFDALTGAWSPILQHEPGAGISSAQSIPRVETWNRDTPDPGKLEWRMNPKTGDYEVKGLATTVQNGAQDETWWSPNGYSDRNGSPKQVEANDGTYPPEARNQDRVEGELAGITVTQAKGKAGARTLSPPTREQEIVNNWDPDKFNKSREELRKREEKNERPSMDPFAQAIKLRAEREEAAAARLATGKPNRSNYPSTPEEELEYQVARGFLNRALEASRADDARSTQTKGTDSTKPKTSSGSTVLGLFWLADQWKANSNPESFYNRGPVFVNPIDGSIESVQFDTHEPSTGIPFEE